MKKQHIFGMLLAAVVALACGSVYAFDASAGASFQSLIGPDLIGSAALGAMSFGMIGDTAIVEIKSLIEKQGQAWEEHKKTNDELLKAKADGKSVSDLEAKLAKIGADLDQYADMKSQIEEIMVKLQRPDVGTDNAAKAIADEVKGFNIALRADFQSKGRQAPGELDAKAYGEYKSGFMKMAAGVRLEHLTADEQKAMQAGSDPDGGYLLPHSTVGRMVTLLREQSVMRQLADVQTISTDKIEGILDLNEADAGWVSELGTRTETTTPQVGKWEIQCHEMYASPKASQKILDDAATDVEAWLAGKVSDKYARVEGTAFWTGTGAGQPRGLAAYTTAATADGSRAWGQFEHVKSGANGDFGAGKADPLQDLIGAFKDRYLQNAQFAMRREVRTKIRKLKRGTADDSYLYEPSLQAGQPDRLMGYNVRIDQYIPTLATDSLSLAFGDFKQAYQIVDRMGIRTLRDPYTAKPYVVFYSTKRTGGGAVNFEAVKFLKFSA